MIVVAITFVLVFLHVPQRVVFSVFASDFQSLAEELQNENAPRDVNRRIGPYHIDRWGVDQNGGVYFRTYTCGDGIGPDQLEFGFAFRPSREGVPFGRTGHTQVKLFGDWFVFSGSDD